MFFLGGNDDHTRLEYDFVNEASSILIPNHDYLMGLSCQEASETFDFIRDADSVKAGPH